MNLHLVALPHTTVSPDFCGCAYTSKVLKFCKMLGLFYNISVYAPEGPPIPYATLIPCLSEIERFAIFGPDDPNNLPAWPSDEDSKLFNEQVIANLKERIEPRDLILLTGGYTHKPIADAFPSHIICEPGVGYEGIFTNYCAFESYAWMHYIYGKKGITDGRWFDTVIPNYFDISDFPTLNSGRGDYLLFLGRLIPRKGPHIASEIARATGMKLVVAGAGGKQAGLDIEASGFTIKDAEYAGPVDVKKRAELLTGAKALIVPTTYIEPFGGVAVEAMMCGTPVISTDWGAFSEIVRPGLSGFRFRTQAEAILAVDSVSHLDPETIRNYAYAHYSLGAVLPKFNKWFNNLDSLWSAGWYS